jgi:hypothetical protein
MLAATLIQERIQFWDDGKNMLKQNASFHHTKDVEKIKFQKDSGTIGMMRSIDLAGMDSGLCAFFCSKSKLNRA